MVLYKGLQQRFVQAMGFSCCGMQNRPQLPAARSADVFLMTALSHFVRANIKLKGSKPQIQLVPTDHMHDVLQASAAVKGSVEPSYARVRTRRGLRCTKV